MLAISAAETQGNTYGHSLRDLIDSAAYADFDLGGVDLRKVVEVNHDVVLQRPKLGMRLVDVNHDVEPVVPMPYHREQADGSNDGRGQWKHDFREQPQFADAVDGCRFFNFLGQAHEELLENQNIPSADNVWKNHRPEVVQQVQLLDDQVVGNQAARKEDREQQKIDVRLLAWEVIP